MRKIVLYGNGGGENHGCEAISRCTVDLLRANGIDNEVIFSPNPEQDIKYGLDELTTIQGPKKNYARKSLSYIYAYLRNKFFHEYGYLDNLQWKPLFEGLSKNDVAFSIGGDCLSYGYSHTIVNMHDMFRAKGMKTILWSCSINPNLLDDARIMRDILNFDAIVARESITYEALIAHCHPNVTLMPDVAFALPKQECDESDLIVEGKTIGINISPMVQSYQNEDDMVLKNYSNLIEHILATTDNNIALIPHVVWKQNDDRKAMQVLYEKYADTGRVYCVSDHNCMELKDIISRCRMMVCARTHASIAAYSTCVPTLVMGYSVKARGIAKDLFGTDENYVVPVQSLKSENDLLEKYKWMEQNEISIREHLQNVMPGYVAGLSKASEVIKRYCCE